MSRQERLKLSRVLRNLNLKYGLEKYMHRNQKVYEHERITDTYIFICSEEDIDVLMEREA